MFTSRIHSKRVVVSAALLITATLLIVFIISARTRNSTASAQSKKRVDLVILGLRPTGFEPNEIRRNRGPFMLVVHNRSNNPDISFRLDHESGRREHEEHLQRGKVDWSKPLDLHPGKYVLSVADHPDWTCQITITNDQ